MARKCSRKVTAAPKKDWDWVSADETGCSQPSERFPGTNPLSPCLPLPSLPPPPSSLPDPPCCHQ